MNQANPVLRTSVHILTSLAILAASATVFAQQAPKPETLIKWRQSAYTVFGWNTNRIKASIEGQYNKDDVIKAANAIAAVSGTGMEKLFPAGTEKGKGWEPTEAHADLFKNMKRFAELNASLTKEASELANVANTGDLAAVKAQFGKMTKACKTCHEDYKVKD